MPSLPPALNPWMMRPRAGQRNSGSTPAASAFAPVSGTLVAVGAGFEVAGRRLVDHGVLRLRRLGRFGIGDRAARVVLGCRTSALPRGRLVGLGEVLLFFLLLRLGGLCRFGVGDVPGALARFLRFRTRHAVAVGVIDGHDDAHPALDLGAAWKGRWRRGARRRARRSGSKAYPKSRRRRPRPASRRRRSSRQPNLRPPAACGPQKRLRRRALQARPAPAGPRLRSASARRPPSCSRTDWRTDFPRTDWGWR